MGADIVAFRGCALQSRLGELGFLRKLKLRAYKDAADRAAPAERRPKLKIVARIGAEPPVTFTYAELAQEVDDLSAGAAECATCPLSGGAPIGCYSYVSYPIEAAVEEALFSVVVRGLSIPGSAAERFVRRVVLPFSNPPSDWLVRRGSEKGSLCLLPAPLEHEWLDQGRARRVSSAELLRAVLAPLHEPSDMRLLAELLTDVAGAASEAGASPEAVLEVRRMAELLGELAASAGAPRLLVES